MSEPLTQPDVRSNDGPEHQRSQPDLDANVCVFTSAHNASDARVGSREAVSLARAGADVTYYTPLGDADLEGVDVENYGSGDDVASVPPVTDRLRWSWRVARRLVDTEYDAYHFHDVELLPVGVWLAARTDATVIYDVHEDVHDVLGHKDIFPKPVRPLLAAAGSGLELLLARFVDAIVVASPDLADRFSNCDDVTVVTNYPWRRYAEETDVCVKAQRARHGEAQFAYCGLLSEDRGIFTVMDAIDRVPDEYDASLVLGGKYASDDVERRIRNRAAESERIELVGWLPGLDDVVDLFRRSDVGIHCFHPDPNKTDAVHRSNKLFQYMAAGVPILTSDVGEWSRLMDEVGCGITVDPRDPDAIAGAMVDFLERPNRRVAYGQNGHRAALEQFNWEIQRERLVALYGRLLE